MTDRAVAGMQVTHIPSIVKNAAYDCEVSALLNVDGISISAALGTISHSSTATIVSVAEAAWVHGDRLFETHGSLGGAIVHVADRAANLAQ